MKKTINLLGIAKKANKICYGETLLLDIKRCKVSLVVICSDTSDNSKKRIIDKCNFYGCKYLIAFNKEDVKKIISREDEVSAVGIKDINLANKIKDDLESEGEVNG